MPGSARSLLSIKNSRTCYPCLNTTTFFLQTSSFPVHFHPLALSSCGFEAGLAGTFPITSELPHLTPPPRKRQAQVGASPYLDFGTRVTQPPCSLLDVWVDSPHDPISNMGVQTRGKSKKGEANGHLNGHLNGSANGHIGPGPVSTKRPQPRKSFLATTTSVAARYPSLQTLL